MLSPFAHDVAPECCKVGGHGMTFTIATTKDLKALHTWYIVLLNSSNVRI